VELEITGMTCASCAARIERKLNRMQGVQASVNYATEKASVEYDPEAVRAEDLITTVEATGYGASLPSAAESEQPEPDPTVPLRNRLIGSAALAAPVLLLSMIPALQFDRWQWLVMLLATPAVLWGGWPFHRAALINLRHRAATMDTLVSVGSLAAWTWSILALFLGDAGADGMRMGFGLVPSRSATLSDIYFEVASVVVAAVLGGRYFEARARRKAGAALKALLELGAKDVSVLGTDGRERRVPVAELRIGDRFVVRPGE
jgi:Cu+-exporting ATPase